MTLKEKKIKDDILNEIEVPNVLNKVRPYAQEQCAEFGSKKISRFSFARVFSIAVAGLVGVVAMVALITVGFGESKSFSDSSKFNNMESSNDKASESTPSESQFSEDNMQGGKGDSHESGALPGELPNDDTMDVYSYYLQEAPSEKLTIDQIYGYYQEITIYVSEGKNVDEVAEIMMEDYENLSRADVEIIYEYISGLE